MTKSSHSKHRDPNIAKAIDLLEMAGYQYDNDDALWTLANIYFVSRPCSDRHQAH